MYSLSGLKGEKKYSVQLETDWMGFLQAFLNPFQFPQNQNISTYPHALTK